MACLLNTSSANPPDLLAPLWQAIQYRPANRPSATGSAPIPAPLWAGEGRGEGWRVASDALTSPPATSRTGVKPRIQIMLFHLRRGLRESTPLLTQTNGCILTEDHASIPVHSS